MNYKIKTRIQAGVVAGLVALLGVTAVTTRSCVKENTRLVNEIMDGAMGEDKVLSLTERRTLLDILGYSNTPVNLNGMISLHPETWGATLEIDGKGYAAISQETLRDTSNAYQWAKRSLD
jgi:hypothetical protein